MEYYRVKAGIWDKGPVAFLSAEALESFEAHGLYLIYDSRNHPGFTLTAEITDKDIQFWRAPTNEHVTHLVLPMENGPRGYDALACVQHEIRRSHNVRCHLYEAMGYWDDRTDRFVIPLPEAPHRLPFPNKKDLTPEMIIADIEARREVVNRLTGRPHVSFPDYYLNALTAEQRVAMFSGRPIPEAVT